MHVFLVVKKKKKSIVMFVVVATVYVYIYSIYMSLQQTFRVWKRKHLFNA